MSCVSKRACAIAAAMLMLLPTAVVVDDAYARGWCADDMVRTQTKFVKSATLDYEMAGIGFAAGILTAGAVGGGIALVKRRKNKKRAAEDETEETAES